VCVNGISRSDDEIKKVNIYLNVETQKQLMAVIGKNLMHLETDDDNTTSAAT